MSAAATALSALRRRGVVLGLRRGTIHIDAPVGVVTPETRTRLAELKPDLLEVLTTEQHVLDLTLDEFAAQDYIVKAAVPWLDEPLWFVPRGEHAGVLARQGIPRGRIWTVRESLQLLSLSGVEREDIESIGQLRAAFGARVLSVERDEPATPAPDAPRRHACPACHEHRFWRSIHGVTICARCHPPAAPDLVAEWVTAAHRDENRDA